MTIDCYICDSTNEQAKFREIDIIDLYAIKAKAESL